MATRILLLICLALAVAVCATTGLLSTRLHQQLVAQTATTLGGDLVVRSKTRFESTLRAELDTLGVVSSAELGIPTVAFAGERSGLVNIRAVDEAWPPRGAAQTAPARPYARPPAGELWVDERLSAALQVGAGDILDIGRSPLRIDAVVTAHPGQGNAGFSALAPQLIMRLEDLEATGLLAEGARSRWYLYLAGDRQQIAAARERAEAAGLPADAPGEARPEIGSALERIRNLLHIATLCSLSLLAGVLFLLGRYQLPAWEYETAVLRSLGASRRILGRRLIRPWARDTGLGILLGLGLAGCGQMLLDRVLLQVWGLDLPPGDSTTYVWAGLAGCLLAAVLLPQIYTAARTSPGQVLRASLAGEMRGLGTGLAWTLLCLAALAVVVSRDASLLLPGLGITLGGAVLLAGLGLLMLRLLPAAGPLTALGQLRQQGAGAGLQLGTLGLGISILLLLAGLQSQIIAPWQDQLPEDAPNRFLLNIQPGQEDILEAALDEAGIQTARVMPMVRGRLVALDGEPVSVDDFADPETQRWINRDFNLSSVATFGSDNILRQGRYWAADSTTAEISVDRYAVERLDLQLDSRLTLNIAGTEYEYTVTSIRDVQWDSLQPNFFLVVPPAVLPTADATWLTSFYLPPGQEALDRTLVQAIPNLTILNLEALISEIREMTGRALLGLQWVFGFTLLSGALLVVAMLLASLPARRQQMTILRALGLSRARLRQMVWQEFALLGALAGAGAVALSQGALAALAHWAFEVSWQPQLSLLWLPPLGAALITAGLGWWLLRSVTEAAPGALLKESRLGR